MRFLLLGLLLAAGVARVAATDSYAVGNALVVNERVVLRLETTQGGHSPAERAALAAHAIESAGLGAVEHERAGAGALILINGRHILTVGALDAQAHETSAQELAAKWAAALQSALELPALKLSPASLRLEVGESARVKLVGSAARNASLAANNGFTVRRVAVGELLITSSESARGWVTATAGSHNLAIPVAALLPPVSLDGVVKAYVAGTPAIDSTVDGAIRGALERRFGAEAEVVVGQYRPLPVQMGAIRDFQVPVSVSAPNRFTATGSVQVTVGNIGIEPISESLLWYSNKPESVPRPMPLGSWHLEPGQPARLLFHHRNRSSAPMTVRFLLVNRTATPARVALMVGESGAEHNPALAGLDAAEGFLTQWMASSYAVIEIAPGEAMPLAMRRLGPRQTMSGLASLRLVEGGPIECVADTVSPLDMSPEWRTAAEHGTAWKSVSPQEAQTAGGYPPGPSYPNPLNERRLDYEVGGQFGYVRLGQVPIESPVHPPLQGNFGVVYFIEGRISNPTGDPQEVSIVYESSAGYGGAMFSLNGRYIRTKMLQPKGRCLLATYSLEPGESRNIRMATLPVSGVSYPATIVARPADISLEVGWPPP